MALGPDLPATFANDDALAADLLEAGLAEGDPLWRMPLWPGYDEMLRSDIADIDNAPEGGMAGRFLYSSELFDPATIRRMADHWVRLLAGVAANPESPLAELPMLAADEQDQVAAGWNQTGDDWSFFVGGGDAFGVRDERGTLIATASGVFKRVPDGASSPRAPERTEA